ncbi:MAG: hypothetical protein M3539_06540 [Acidobacteriota bacterium]|nr:hypothetical protein [Acidobacteriota bacterium]
MKRLLFFIVVPVLLAFEGSSAVAQTNNPLSVEERPCSAEVGLAPGRPTLKRRAPATPPTDSVNQKLLDKEKCKGEDPASDSLNNQNPIGIQFEGLHTFSEVDMIKAFRERRIELPKTQMPSPEVRDKAVTLIKELLESRGHFHATVNSRSDEEAGTLVFLVNEGQRLALTEVRFEGNRSFSSQELTSKMGEYLAAYPKIQEAYDSPIFEHCTRRLLNFIRSRGYLQATFGEPTKQIEGCGLVVIIRVNEGVLYRLGEIKIQGAEAVAQENVRAMLSLRQGDIASGDDIGKWLFEDVKRLYGELGHIEFTAEPEPEFKAANGANEGVVDFKVTIEEGRRFKVHGIRFQGSSLPDNELLGLLRIHAGDIFNQRLLEESIKQLNQSGRFESIDKDRDIDFRTDEEEAVIDIVIKVNAKGGAVEARDSSLTRRQP